MPGIVKICRNSSIFCNCSDITNRYKGKITTPGLKHAKPIITVQEFSAEVRIHMKNVINGFQHQSLILQVQITIRVQVNKRVRHNNTTPTILLWKLTVTYMEMQLHNNCLYNFNYWSVITSSFVNTVTTKQCRIYNQIKILRILLKYRATPCRKKMNECYIGLLLF